MTESLETGPLSAGAAGDEPPTLCSVPCGRGERGPAAARQGERAVDEVAGVVGARVGDAQRASPAVEITLAVVGRRVVLATPGVNAPNVAGVPSVSASVAGTEPPAPPVADVSESGLVAADRDVLGRSRWRWRP